jgi:hypothetical protein
LVEDGVVHGAACRRSDEVKKVTVHHTVDPLKVADKPVRVGTAGFDITGKNAGDFVCMFRDESLVGATRPRGGGDGSVRRWRPLDDVEHDVQHSAGRRVSKGGGGSIDARPGKFKDVTSVLLVSGSTAKGTEELE